jgi:hypothetical protein
MWLQHRFEDKGLWILVVLIEGGSLLRNDPRPAFPGRITAIRKLSYPFYRPVRSLGRLYWIETRNCQFGWLRGSRKLMKGKISWLRGPATIRIV